MQTDSRTRLASQEGQQPGRKTMDADVLDYARQIFQLVRSGDAQTLQPLLERGLTARDAASVMGASDAAARLARPVH